MSMRVCCGRNALFCPLLCFLLCARVLVFASMMMIGGAATMGCLRLRCPFSCPFHAIPFACECLCRLWAIPLHSAPFPFLSPFLLSRLAFGFWFLVLVLVFGFGCAARHPIGRTGLKQSSRDRPQIFCLRTTHKT